MKPILRRALGLGLVIACFTVWSLTLGMARRQLGARTCQGKGTLDVIVTDSLERNFVGRENVEAWLDKEYRAYAGLPLDSVDLTRIESIVTGHSAVRECEAWLTDDGILHVRLSQREPLVRFDDGHNGYYADEGGFIFPLQARGSVDVPVVDGHLPLSVPRGYKGEITDPAQREWVMRVLHLVGCLKDSAYGGVIRRVSASADGDLVLYPAEGGEKFLLGQPVRVEEKIGLLEKYYSRIAPGHDYGTVDLRYAGQIVCKK